MPTTLHTDARLDALTSACCKAPVDISRVSWPGNKTKIVSGRCDKCGKGDCEIVVGEVGLPTQ